MKTSAFHLIIIILLTLCFYHKLLGQDPKQHCQSNENFLAYNSKLSFKSNVRSIEFDRYSYSSDITFYKTNYIAASMSMNEKELDPKSSINLIFSSERNLGYMNNSNNFESLCLLGPSPFTASSMSIKRIEFGLEPNINKSFSSERNLDYMNNSNNIVTFCLPSPSPTVGETVGKFFWGVLVGAVIGTAMALVMTSGEETTYVPGVGTVTTGNRDTSMDSMVPVIITACGLVGGIMFAIKW